MKQTNILSAAVLTLLITACAHPDLTQQNGWQPAETVNDFSAEGRIAVKLEGKGSYANFDWTYQNQVQTININTPIGSTVGQLCQDNQGVLAVDNKGRTYEAATAQELSNRLLGFELPIQYLHIWASGKRVADAPYQLLPDSRLQQFGWTISRTLNSNSKPKTLLLESPKLTLRLAFDNLDDHPEGNTQTQCAARK